MARPLPDPRESRSHVFSGRWSPCRRRAASRRSSHVFPPSTTVAHPEATRINMLTAIRRTLDVELASNKKMVVFGEDVGPKGGVHGATLGLQEKYGQARVFDTSLSEEGIIGRAVGMAVAGLLPVAEIQFRKYADPAAEQLNDCGTMRWRTNNRFAAPMVVRMPGGFFKCGDPWHSQTNEVAWVHGLAGTLPCLRMPRMRWDCCGPRCAEMIRRSFLSTGPCWTMPGRVVRIPVMTSSFPSVWHGPFARDLS